jgi:HKD family nuclease
MFIQDPTNSEAYSLHEALIQACDGATGGGGIFAFASRQGVDLYLNDAAFFQFGSRAKFDLIIGIDEITNLKTIERLSELQSSISGLNVSAFLHDIKGSLFHPKFCWFRKKKTGSLIVGSGNLTAGGLRKNWEAFSIVELSSKELQDFETEWGAWKRRHSERLKPLENEDVKNQAKANIFKRRVVLTAAVLGKPVEELAEEESTEDRVAWDFSENSSVLIYEIPKSKDRWKQANFDLETFKTFFGAKLGEKNQRILLRQIMIDGKLGDIEVRPSVAVKSKNYRFELGAASGLAYPSTGRPIGIFIRVSVRMFIYQLVMPNDAIHEKVAQYLQQVWKGRADRMRHLTLKAKEIENGFPELPFWKIEPTT